MRLIGRLVHAVSVISFLLFAAYVLPVLSAAGNTDFSGTWKLDVARSDFGRIPAPSSLTDNIAQDDRALTIQRERDGQPVKLRIPLDGSTIENSLRGVPMKTTARWENATLIVTSNGHHFGGEVGYEERWTLSQDHKSLTIQRHLIGPQGATDQTVVLAKQ